MELDRIRRIAVAGAGLMGHGIALGFATAGYPVGLYDLTDEILYRSMSNIQADLNLMAGAGLLGHDQIEPALSRIQPTTDLRAVAEYADVVIEAVAEKLEVKLDLFRKLDELSSPQTIFASNSSTLTPSKLAPATHRPERLLVAHYWNPPYLLPLVELVGGPQTAPDVIETMRQLMEKIGKKPVVMKKEALGFIGNRLQFALYREALNIVERGLASPEDVDLVVTHSLGRRLAVAGPFEVAELGGLDVFCGASTYLWPDLSDAKEPPAILRQRVERGDLGIKTGRGFYHWSRETAEALRQRVANMLIWFQVHSRQ